MSDVDTWIVQLRSPKASERKDAANRLSLAHDEAKPAVAVLLTMVDDPSKTVRQAVASALGAATVEEPAHVEQVLAWLRRYHERDEMRLTAYSLASSLRDVAHDWIDPMLEVLADPSAHEEVRTGLGEQLAELVYTTRPHSPPRRRLRPAVAPLVELFSHPSAETRQTAALLVGRLGLAEGLSPLLPLLDDPDEQVVEGAAHAVTCIARVHASPALELLGHPHWRVRREGVEGLVHVKGIDYEPLVPLLERIRESDEHPTVRKRAGWALNEIRRQFPDLA